MFVAMNRFEIALGFEEGFEKIWRERDSQLESVPGFETFHLLKGPTTDKHTLYASHTVWQDRDSFINWSESDAFRAAHAQTSAPKGTYLGHPQLETFASVSM